ncbi:MAG: hypothetical protein RLZ45_50 [Verrucomicrobiota bacterium]|jgi:hypothetical protein
MKPPQPNAPVPLHEDPRFRFLVMSASALGLGGMLASLTFLDKGPHGFEFHWSSLALPAFALGIVLSSAYWWIVFRMTARSGRLGPGFLTTASAAVMVLAILAFLYPIRFIPAAKRTDVVIGLTLAVLVLGTIGYIIHTMVRWLEQESAEDPPEGSTGDD